MTRSHFFRLVLLLLGLSLNAEARVRDEFPDLKVDRITRERQKKAAKPRRYEEDGDEEDETLGENMKELGEGVAQRIDRVVKKNGFRLWGEPWTIQGLPILFPSGSTGFNLGLRILLNNMKRVDPHKLEIEAQVLSSDRGRYKYFLRFDQPHAFDGKFRLQARVAYDRDIHLPYFGIGNETPIDIAAFNADAVLYQNVRAGPSVTLQILRNIGKHWRFGPILGLRWTTVTAPTGSLLASQQPIGIAGGRTHYLGFAVVYDGLDFEPYPTRGSYHELYFAAYLPAFGSNYRFFRTTYTFRKYIRLHRELTLAHRTFFEALTGDVPFYEMGATGGSNSTIAFGGDRFYRGFQSNRFIDQVRLALGFEMRWDPLEFTFAKQEVTIGFVPFLDFGRVWDKLLPFQLGRWHATAGWGGRITWNRRLVIRGDFSFTPEGTAFYMELGHSF